MNPVTARWLLWVDGVGGFLLLPGDDWTIGGPTGAEEADICIQADLASRAAGLRRQGGDYVLQPFTAALLGQRRMHRPTLLRDGDVITLGQRPGVSSGESPAATYSPLDSLGSPGSGRHSGPTVPAGGIRLRFAKPHPLSSSARLSIDSRHRVRPRCDAMILLADTCILGPSPSSHVVVPGIEKELVLLFSSGRWWCRGAGETIVAGKPHQGRVAVAPGARVESGGVAFSLEAT